MPAKNPKKSNKLRLSREQILQLIEIFEGEVNNGGFDQFFSNSAGNNTIETLHALRTIRAAKIAGILERAAKKFPGGTPPKHRMDREKLLMTSVSPKCDAFKDLDKEFYSCSDELQGCLEKYMDWV